MRSETVSTGVLFLDQLLGGGIPEMSVVCIFMDSFSGAELLLHQLATIRKTYYFALSHTPEDVRSGIEMLGGDWNKVELISGDEARYLLGKKLEMLRDGNDSGFTVILDSFSFFLTVCKSQEKISKMLGLLRDIASRRKSLVVFSIYKGTHSKNVENLVLSSADVIFDVGTVTSGERQETILSIPKIRGLPPVGKIRVIFGERIDIDTSRPIA